MPGRFSIAELPEAALLFAGFLAVLFLGSRFIPAQEIPGRDSRPPDTSGSVLNGFSLFFLVTVVTGVGQIAGWWSLSLVYRLIAELFVVGNIFTVIVVLALIRSGRRKARVRRKLFDEIYYGLESNPRWLGVDLKMFSYRPSLIGLVIINASFAAQQFEMHGTISTAMWLYQAFTFIYVFNYFQFEYGMVYTWDIVAEKFSGMLVWGDYVLVPFFYSLPGWFLIDRVAPLRVTAVVGLVMLYIFGFWLFRGANEQKHRFKLDPTSRIWGRPAETLDGRLLVSGFWGIGRHLNYTGKICIYLAFALTTGLASFVPYILPAWLAGLLVHRALRDDRRCRDKYGELWTDYTARARFRMIPLIY